MERTKRIINKPTIYQTTSSDDDTRTRPQKQMKKDISDTMSQDINDLRKAVDDASSNNTYNIHDSHNVQTQQTRDVNTQSQILNSHMLSPQVSHQHTSLGTPIRTEYATHDTNNALHTVQAMPTAVSRFAFPPNESNNYGKNTYTNLDDVNSSQPLNIIKEDFLKYGNHNQIIQIIGIY